MSETIRYRVWAEVEEVYLNDDGDTVDSVAGYIRGRDPEQLGVDFETEEEAIDFLADLGSPPPPLPPVVTQAATPNAYVLHICTTNDASGNRRHSVAVVDLASGMPLHVRNVGPEGEREAARVATREAALHHPGLWVASAVHFLRVDVAPVEWRQRWSRES